MRVLWLSPAQPSAVVEHLGGDAGVRGGWIEALRDVLAQTAGPGDEPLELAVASMSVERFEPFEQDGIVYYPLVARGTTTRLGRMLIRATFGDRSVDFTSDALAAIEDFAPDLVHVHGTESTLGRVIGRTDVPVLVSLQGIVGSLVEHYFDGVRPSEIARDAVRLSSIVRGVGLLPQYLAHRRSLRVEREVLGSARYFTGRTGFDRHVAAEADPGAPYFHCDRVLRDEFYGPYRRPEPTGPVVFCTGGPAPYKGIEVLLAATAKLVERGVDVRVRIAGPLRDSTMWPVLDARTVESGVSDRVEWLGPLGPADLIEELESCRVYVHPSHADNSPNSLAEAMSRGAACVASATGGIPSMLADGHDGLLFPPGDATALADALGRVLDSDGLRDRLGDAARERAVGRHDRHAIAAATREMYRAIVDPSGSPAAGDDEQSLRIIVANKFWYRRGGLESVMFDEVAALEAAGHHVAHFSTSHPDNDASHWSDYFAPYIELGEAGGLGLGERVVALLRMFHNGAAAERFARLVADFAPDVIHIHGIHRQLSPSILGVARRAGVPVVQTLHDCHHICPEDHLLRAGEHRCVPRRCGRLWYGPALANRCVRGSLAASAASALETAWQRLWKAYERGVTRFISPSEFLKDQMADGGWDLPCDVVPNPVAAPDGSDAAVNGAGTGALYVGRLSREKGVEVALEAARRAGVALTVLGEGPQGEELVARYPEATFVGRVDALQVTRHIQEARAVVVPSVCIENAPMAIVEAMAVGRPVIASDVGGVGELVDDGRTGLLVDPGDVDALASALTALDEDPDRAVELGSAGRVEIGRRFSPDIHLQGILASYEQARAAVASGVGA